MLHHVRARLAIVALCLLALGAASVNSLRAQTQTPTQIFTAYRATLARATAYAELFPFMESRGRAMIEGIPEPQRGGMFSLLKRFADTYSEVAVAGETVTGDTAVLSLTGKDTKGQPAAGSVPMTREADGWKVGTERWSSRPR
mgnify:CR=1 FL=1